MTEPAIRSSVSPGAARALPKHIDCLPNGSRDRLGEALHDVGKLRADSAQMTMLGVSLRGGLALERSRDYLGVLVGVLMLYAVAAM